MNGTPTVVNDVMTRRVVALRTGAAFKDIVRTMQERRVSALAVLDEGGRVVGVVSEAGLLPRRTPSSPAPRASWLAQASNGCRWSVPTALCGASSAGPTC